MYSDEKEYSKHQNFGHWPNSLDCTDLKISVEPDVTQYCVASVTYISVVRCMKFSKKVLFKEI